MRSDLLTQLQMYGLQLDDEARPLPTAPPVGPIRERRLLRRQPWAVAAAAAAAMIVLISGAAWLSRGQPAPPVDEVPEIWTTYTAASDGIVSECLCQMAMAPDGSIWVVGWDGISRFDGLQWDRVEPPRAFSGDGWPAVVAAPDGSVWIMGMSYIARYSDGAWDPIVEAGFQDDGGPLFFEGLWVDEEAEVWTRLADQPGMIQDGGFVPRDLVESEEGFVAPEGLTVLATAPDGSTWMAMGDSIVGVDGALIEYDGRSYTAYDLGGVREAVFEEDGTGWFLVPQVGADAWMFGREQWSDPGLYRLDGGDWYRITLNDGLAGYRISAMLHAPDGALWMSTPDGEVTRYQPGSNPQSGTRVQIDSRPFTEADMPPPAYPPATVPDSPGLTVPEQ